MPIRNPCVYLIRHVTFQVHGVLVRISPGYPPITGRLHTCYSPVRRSPPKYCYLVLPLDLHVLGLSLAFILSQDQTLHCISFFVFFLWLQHVPCFPYWRGTFLLVLLPKSFSDFKKFPFPYTTSCCCISSQRSLAPSFSSLSAKALSNLCYFLLFWDCKVISFYLSFQIFFKIFSGFFIPVPLLNFALLPFSRKAAAKLILFSFSCKQILEKNTRNSNRLFYLVVN